MGQSALSLVHRQGMVPAGQNGRQSSLLDSRRWDFAQESLHLAGCGKTLKSTQDSKGLDAKRRHIALSAQVARNRLFVRHIWGEPWNPDASTAGWNLCYMPLLPRGANGTTTLSRLTRIPELLSGTPTASDAVGL